MNNGLTLCGMGTDGLSSAIFRAAGRLQRRGVEAAAVEPGFCSTGQSFLAGLQGRRERKAPVSRIAHTWRQSASEVNPEAKNNTFFPERKQPPDPAGRIGLTERNGPGYGFLARELPGEALQLFGREREFERFTVQQLMAAVPHG